MELERATQVQRGLRAAAGAGPGSWEVGLSRGRGYKPGWAPGGVELGPLGGGAEQQGRGHKPGWASGGVGRDQRAFGDGACAMRGGSSDGKQRPSGWGDPQEPVLPSSITCWFPFLGLCGSRVYLILVLSLRSSEAGTLRREAGPSGAGEICE